GRGGCAGVSGCDVVRILDPDDGPDEYRVRISIGARCITRGHRQWRRSDGECAVVGSYGVIAELAIWIYQGGAQRISSHRACRCCRTRINRSDVVIVLEAGDGAGESRIGVAIEPGRVTRSNGQSRGSDGERSVG